MLLSSLQLKARYLLTEPIHRLACWKMVSCLLFPKESWSRAWNLASDRLEFKSLVLPPDVTHGLTNSQSPHHQMGIIAESTHSTEVAPHLNDTQ